MLLCSVATAAEPAAPVPETRFFFDARQPFAQPMVRVDAFGRSQTMVLDTGSSLHVIGFKGAGLTPVATTFEDVVGVDYAGRGIRQDGRVSFSKASREDDAVVHAELDAAEERRWFEEHVGALLVTLARAHEREVIEEALAALPRHLAAILDDRRMSLAQRRHILFLLWDEMAEPDDAERGWAGAHARRLIDAFVQRRLPPGTPGAFSAAELAGLNRTRRNGILFDPYARPADRDRDPGPDDDR